jgi:hypothetical protein
MKITVHEDFDTGDFCLYATNHARTAICGERIFRGYPRPDVKFRHATREAAEADAATLQNYLDNPPKKSRTVKRKVGAFGEMDDPVWASSL